MPAPRKFQNPTATRNITAQRCGNGVSDRASCAEPSWRNDHASTVRNVSGITSAAEKKAPKGHVLRRLAGEVQVVHRADHAAGRVEDDVEEDDRERDALPDDTEQDEHVRDHHGREQLEKILDPEVDDPEAPELDRGEVVAGACDQPDRIERGNRAGGQEEEPRHVPHVLAGEPPAQRAPEHEQPDEQADDEQDLPEAGEVEVLEALQAEPVGCDVLEHAVEREERADQRSEDDDGEGAEEGERELALVLRLPPGDHRREEDPGGDERGSSTQTDRGAARARCA